MAEANGYYRVTDDRAQLQTQVEMKSGLIRSSLFAATDDASIPDSIAMQLGDVFSGDIDFHRDLRKGDRFSVIYELHYLNGRPVRAGRVLAAEFTNNGRPFRAVQFGNGYYSPDGNNLRKAFLRSPLEFSRVTSGFGMRRHPIAQAWRAAHRHRLRRADRHARARRGRRRGRVRRPKGGYGNVVILRHHGQYATVYAHLRRVAVRKGARVAQNDTIGASARPAGPPARTCTTNSASPARRATRSPSRCRPRMPVAQQDLPAFRNQAAALVERLDLLANVTVAQSSSRSAEKQKGPEGPFSFAMPGS